jgi:hypothetical protein
MLSLTVLAIALDLPKGMFTPMLDGGTAEVEVIGREGLVGSLHLLGSAPVSHQLLHANCPGQRSASRLDQTNVGFVIPQLPSGVTRSAKNELINTFLSPIVGRRAKLRSRVGRRHTARSAVRELPVP